MPRPIVWEELNLPIKTKFWCSDCCWSLVSVDFSQCLGDRLGCYRVWKILLISDWIAFMTGANCASCSVHDSKVTYWLLSSQSSPWNYFPTLKSHLVSNFYSHPSCTFPIDFRNCDSTFVSNCSTIWTISGTDCYTRSFLKINFSIT